MFLALVQSLRLFFADSSPFARRHETAAIVEVFGLMFMSGPVKRKRVLHRCWDWRQKMAGSAIQVIVFWWMGSNEWHLDIGRFEGVVCCEVGAFDL